LARDIIEIASEGGLLSYDVDLAIISLHIGYHHYLKSEIQ